MEEYNELDSTCGVSDDELTKRFLEAVRIDDEIRRDFSHSSGGISPHRSSHPAT